LIGSLTCCLRRRLRGRGSRVAAFQSLSLCTEVRSRLFKLASSPIAIAPFHPVLGSLAVMLPCWRTCLDRTLAKGVADLDNLDSIQVLFSWLFRFVPPLVDALNSGGIVSTMQMHP
jgi:hypothetical protein